MFWGIPAIVAGNSAGSRLIHLVAGREENLLMPPAGGKLSDEEIYMALVNFALLRFRYGLRPRPRGAKGPGGASHA